MQQTNDSEQKFSALLEQVQKCVDQKLFLVATMTALTIPAICGDFLPEKNAKDQQKYQAWFDKWVSPKYSKFEHFTFYEQILTGENVYYLRCAMLHQGKTEHRKTGKVIFSEFPQSPAGLVPPFLLTDFGILVIEPVTFCTHMISAAYDWLDYILQNEYFEKEMESFMTLYSLSFH